MSYIYKIIFLHLLRLNVFRIHRIIGIFAIRTIFLYTIFFSFMEVSGVLWKYKGDVEFIESIFQSFEDSRKNIVK